MKKQDNILKLLTPSWVVNVAGGAIAFLTTAAIIVGVNYRSSPLRLQVFDVQSRSIVDKQQGIYANITLDQQNTSFIGSLPLLLTWAFIGLLVYFCAIAVAHSLGRAAQLHEEMSYVHAKPDQLRRQTLTVFMLRVIAIVVWFLFAKLSADLLVPYALASAGAASSGLSLAAYGYAMLAILVLYLTVVGNVICLRLVLLKTRVFSN